MPSLWPMVSVMRCGWLEKLGQVWHFFLKREQLPSIEIKVPARNKYAKYFIIVSFMSKLNFEDHFDQLKNAIFFN